MRCIAPPPRHCMFRWHMRCVCCCRRNNILHHISRIDQNYSNNMLFPNQCSRAQTMRFYTRFLLRHFQTDSRHRQNNRHNPIHRWLPHFLNLLYNNLHTHSPNPDTLFPMKIRCCHSYNHSGLMVSNYLCMGRPFGTNSIFRCRCPDQNGFHPARPIGRNIYFRLSHWCHRNYCWCILCIPKLVLLPPHHKQTHSHCLSQTMYMLRLRVRWCTRCIAPPPRHCMFQWRTMYTRRCRRWLYMFRRHKRHMNYCSWYIPHRIMIWRMCRNFVTPCIVRHLLRRRDRLRDNRSGFPYHW